MHERNHPLVFQYPHTLSSIAGEIMRRRVRHHQLSLIIMAIAAVCLWWIASNGWSTAAGNKARGNAPEQRLAPDNLTTTMYGGNGGHSNTDSINDGSLVIIDQTNAAITLVGHPNGVARLTG